ncbi:MAG: GDSL-type esterase/lipase family protein [Gemmataceae bacterium]
MRTRLPLAAGLLVLSAAGLPAQDATDNNPAVKKLNRDIPRHKKFLEVVAKGDADVVFIGDSITQGWEGNGKKAWETHFAPLKAVNLGIGGDQTGHVLWRITDGNELDPINPKVAVVMIGTNNMRTHAPDQIAGGVKAIVNELKRQKPQMKILLLGIFPRSAKPTDEVREKVAATNVLLAKLGDGKMVVYRDIGAKFLEPDGTLEKKIMPDLLHLSPAGYDIWAEAITPDLKKLLK